MEIFGYHALELELCLGRWVLDLEVIAFLLEAELTKVVQRRIAVVLTGSDATESHLFPALETLRTQELRHVSPEERTVARPTQHPLSLRDILI